MSIILGIPNQWLYDDSKHFFWGVNLNNKVIQFVEQKEKNSIFWILD